jgi:hypothetical protein
MSPSGRNLIPPFVGCFTVTVLNDRIIDEWLIGKDLEGNNRDIIETLPRNLDAENEENHTKPSIKIISLGRDSNRACISPRSHKYKVRILITRPNSHIKQSKGIPKGPCCFDTEKTTSQCSQPSCAGSHQLKVRECDTACHMSRGVLTDKSGAMEERQRRRSNKLKENYSIVTSSISNLTWSH